MNKPDLKSAQLARVQHLRWMIQARLLDERLAILYRQGHIPGGSVFLGKGQEAVSAALGMYLRKGDVFCPLIRDTAARLVFGEDLLTVARTNLMRRTGPMKGRDGNIHRGQLEKNMIPMISHLGAMVSVVVGTLLARRLRGELSGTDLMIGATCIGDGGMQTGAFHEGLNIAAIEKLPLVLIAADNQLSYSTLTDRTYACKTLFDRAIGYGIDGHQCDGTDSDACLATVGEAVKRARAGKGPQMVVATLLRGSGHGEHDDASYVPAELKARFGDCLALTEKKLLREKAVSETDLVSWRNDATTAINDAIAQAMSEPTPDPAKEDWCAYSERHLKDALIDRDAR
jgi:pyruvate dehydrogenase E1 component alpha subunit/2-oxoisovalerate dehydrogenase E1 component alpha subunit